MKRVSIVAAMVIAIDGPAGAGKSTLARALAEALGFTYLDSGAMYRSVALSALERGISLDDGDELGELARTLDIQLDNGTVRLGDRDVSQEIRSPEVTAAASEVSARPEVRRELVAKQRDLIASGNYVAEGRDIGTEVSTDALLKIFLIADLNERARRRSAETGEPLEDVLAAITARDERDVVREHGALKRADDAITLDTTGLRVEEVVSKVVSLARDKGIA